MEEQKKPMTAEEEARYLQDQIEILAEFTGLPKDDPELIEHAKIGLERYKERLMKSSQDMKETD